MTNMKLIELEVRLPGKMSQILNTAGGEVSDAYNGIILAQPAGSREIQRRGLLVLAKT